MKVIIRGNRIHCISVYLKGAAMRSKKRNTICGIVTVKIAMNQLGLWEITACPAVLLVRLVRFTKPKLRARSLKRFLSVVGLYMIGSQMCLRLFRRAKTEATFINELGFCRLRLYASVV